MILNGLVGSAHPAFLGGLRFFISFFQSAIRRLQFAFLFGLYLQILDLLSEGVPVNSQELGGCHLHVIYPFQG